MTARIALSTALFGDSAGFLTLGLTTRYGVLRHAWVFVELAPILSVITVGATPIRPAFQPGDPSATSLIPGSL